MKLIVTVDNGISAVEEIAYARSWGIDVVVTDHHQPQETLPEAAAVVDPHRADCPSEFKDYAGVGVAFQLVCALEGDVESVLERYADLVALGTLADVMPLGGKTARWCKRGLRMLGEGGRLGLRSSPRSRGWPVSLRPPRRPYLPWRPASTRRGEWARRTKQRSCS